MSVEDIREKMREKAGYAEPKTPSACEGCYNLRRVSTSMSRPVLICMLEKSTAIMQGPIDQLLQTSGRGMPATAGWVARALFEEDLDPEPGQDRGAIDFRDKANAANADCPVIDTLIGQLADAESEDEANIVLPEPILSTEKFEEIS